MRFLAGQRAYAAHPDPATAAANLIALVVAWNGPFYPLYVFVLVGWKGPALLLTMLATPLFFAVPWLSRRSGSAGRAALALVGTANTLWCGKLLGGASGVGLFLLPCLAVAALLFRRRERWLCWTVLASGLAAYFVPDRLLEPLLSLSADDMAKLAGLNQVSVAFLLALIALQVAGVFTRLEAGDGAQPPSRAV